MSVSSAEKVAPSLRDGGARELRDAVGGLAVSRPRVPREVIISGEPIAAQLSAVRIASRRIARGRVAGEDVRALHESVGRAGRTPAVPWDRKAAAYAELFNVLADAMGDDLVAPVLRDGAKLDYELMAAAGSHVDAMIVGSRSRFLACLRDGDAEAAALEVERHLRVLQYMWDLAA